MKVVLVVSKNSMGTVWNCSVAFSLVVAANEALKLDVCSWHGGGAWLHVPTWSGVV